MIDLSVTGFHFTLFRYVRISGRTCHSVKIIIHDLPVKCFTKNFNCFSSSLIKYNSIAFSHLSHELVTMVVNRNVSTISHFKG